MPYLLVLIALVACSGEGRHSRLPALPGLSISGTVRDADGKAVQGAHVELVAITIEAETVSNADGAFQLPVPRAGTWHVSAHAAGHRAAFVEGVSVGSGESRADVVLGTGGVEVVVKATADAPLPADAALVIVRESESKGDAWFVPIDRATNTARIRVQASAKYFVDAVGLLSGSVVLTQPSGSIAVHVPQPPSENDVAYVRTHGVPIASVDPAVPGADLAGFGKLIGDVPIVGLGEATHGTHEFFQLKHRLFAYLAAHKGFTILAFEADQAESRAVDAFVQGTAAASVTARSAVEGIALPTWQTEEVVALVQWMHDYNKTAKERVHFVGYDMQSWRAARMALGAFLTLVDQDAARELALATAALDAPLATGDWTEGVYAKLSVEKKAAIRAALEKVAAVVDKHPAIDGAEDARRDATSLLQWHAYQQQPPSEPLREQFMAENLMKLPDDAKIVVWGHNYHVGRYAETTSMATHLSKAWGSEYLAVGFVFGGGTFTARTLKDLGDERAGYTEFRAQTIREAAAVDVVAPFVRAGAPLMALDLRGLPERNWFRGRHPIRELGWLFYSERMLPRSGVLTDRFDAVVFVSQSSAAQLLSSSSSSP